MPSFQTPSWPLSPISWGCLALAAACAFPAVAIAQSAPPSSDTSTAGSAAARPAAALPTIAVKGKVEELPGDLSPTFGGGQVARGADYGVLGKQRNIDVPFSMTTYTSKLIEDQQARTLADVLDNDPAVRSAFGYGNFSQVFIIRGFQLNGDDVSLNGLYGVTRRAVGGHRRGRADRRAEGRQRVPERRLADRQRGGRRRQHPAEARRRQAAHARDARRQHRRPGGRAHRHRPALRQRRPVRHPREPGEQRRLDRHRRRASPRHHPGARARLPRRQAAPLRRLPAPARARRPGPLGGLRERHRRDSRAALGHPQLRPALGLQRPGGHGRPAARRIRLLPGLDRLRGGRRASYGTRTASIPRRPTTPRPAPSPPRA